MKKLFRRIKRFNKKDISEYLTKIKAEDDRNRQYLHLTANEPLMSDTARQFFESRISDRYYMGGGNEGVVINGGFTALGFEGVQQLVDAAESVVKRQLGATCVNLNCLSGLHAMMCVLLTVSEPDDVIMSMSHDQGGHFATKGIIERIGRKHVYSVYSFDSQQFNTKEIKKIVEKNNVQALYLDASYYLDRHNIKELREALGDDVLIIYDASHTMGLILGGEFQDPLREGADVVCANTHKTLPGPQKGMIAFKDKQLGERANSVINNCLVSSPHLHSLIALSITLLEMSEFGSAYARQVVVNANTLGRALASFGHKLRTAKTGEFTQNHQIHLITDQIGPFEELYRAFVRNSIAVNFNNMFDVGAFIRLGVQEITRRGMMEEEMEVVAKFIDASLQKKNISKEVQSFVAKYQNAAYSFDSVN